MKQISFSFFISIFLLFFFSSCQKEISSVSTRTDTTGGRGTGGGGAAGGSGYYIKGKKDGVQKTYTFLPSANIINASSLGFISLGLVAGTSNSAEGLNIGINFFNTATIKTGIYSEDYFGLDYLVAGVYSTNSPGIIYSAGLQSPSLKPLVITILTKTTNEMTGKFEGAFYKQDSNGIISPAEYILFTEGEFKLPIK